MAVIEAFIIIVEVFMVTVGITKMIKDRDISYGYFTPLIGHESHTSLGMSLILY